MDVFIWSPKKSPQFVLGINSAETLNIQFWNFSKFARTLQRWTRVISTPSLSIRNSTIFNGSWTLSEKSRLHLQINDLQRQFALIASIHGIKNCCMYLTLQCKLTLKNFKRVQLDDYLPSHRIRRSELIYALRWQPSVTIT